MYTVKARMIKGEQNIIIRGQTQYQETFFLVLMSEINTSLSMRSRCLPYKLNKLDLWQGIFSILLKFKKEIHDIQSVI